MRTIEEVKGFVEGMIATYHDNDDYYENVFIESALWKALNYIEGQGVRE